MEKLSEITAAVETKLTKLIQHLDTVVKENEVLKNEILQQQTQQNELQNQYTDLKQKYDQLKIANALLGSEDFKKDTKLKINSIVREIDHCITQLTLTKD